MTKTIDTKLLKQLGFAGGEHAVANGAFSEHYSDRSLKLLKGDLRRVFIVGGVLASQGGRATVAQIVERTGFARSTVIDTLVRLRTQVPGIVMENEECSYHVITWGDPALLPTDVLCGILADWEALMLISQIKSW